MFIVCNWFHPVSMSFIVLFVDRWMTLIYIRVDLANYMRVAPWLDPSLAVSLPNNFTIFAVVIAIGTRMICRRLALPKVRTVALYAQSIVLTEEKPCESIIMDYFCRTAKWNTRNDACQDYLPKLGRHCCTSSPRHAAARWALVSVVHLTYIYNVLEEHCKLLCFLGMRQFLVDLMQCLNQPSILARQ